MARPITETPILTGQGGAVLGKSQKSNKSHARRKTGGAGCVQEI